MNYPRVKFAAAFFLFFQINLIQAQIQKGELTKGKTHTSVIAPNEKHGYKIRLAKDQFVFIKLMQKGVDLKITTFDAKGEKIDDFDSPNGKDGLELFTIVSGSQGEYSIEVSPIDEKEPGGSYDLSIQLLKPKAVSPSEQVDQLLAAWDNKESPGAAIAVVKDGAIIYKKGYGMANLEYDMPISTSSIFHIASVSKQFTVFSILLLEKQGKLNLADDIRKYIPEVPDFGKTITLKHLASHTSGLRDQWNLLAMAGWRLDDVITKEQVLKLVSKQKALNFDPGEEYLYCNTGFTLLGEVVARVSGLSFAAFTKAYIFDPLKMNNTLFYDDHEKIVKNRAYSYYSGSGSLKKSVLNYANVGATSLFTTAEDLSLWAMNFSKLTIGDTGIINKMSTLAVLNNGKTFGGALGQFVGTYKGLKEIQHGGADAGYRSYLTRFPEQNMSVIVLSNSAEFSAGGIAHKITDIYLKDKIKVEPKEELIKKESPAGPITIDPTTLKTYVGDFELQPGFIISLSEDNGHLSAQATGQPVVKLTPLSVTEFKVEGVEAKIEVLPNGGENINSIKLHQGGEIREAKRVKAFDRTTVKLEDFSGSFYSEELSTTYHFTVVDGKLIAKHNRLSDFNLNPVKEDVFSGDAWYFSQIEFIRDENNNISGCKVSAGRVRNLYFKKLDQKN